VGIFGDGPAEAGDGGKEALDGVGGGFVGIGGHALSTLVEEPGIELLLPVAAFGYGEDGLAEPKGLTDELVSGCTDEAMAGSEVGEKGLIGNGEKLDLAAAGKGAETINPDGPTAGFEGVEETLRCSAAKVRDEVFSVGGHLAADLGPEEDPSGAHWDGGGEERGLKKSGNDGRPGSWWVMGAGEGGHEFCAPAQGCGKVAQVAVAEEGLVVHDQERYSGQASGPGKGGFEVGNDEVHRCGLEAAGRAATKGRLRRMETPRRRRSRAS
jgi:hypothetical protein